MIKLFENFNEAPEFTQKISTDDVYVSLYKEPGSLRSASVRSGEVKWTMDVSYRKWGIELGKAQLTYLEIVLEIEDPESEDGDTFEKTITVTKEQLLDSFERTEQELEGFPLSLSDLEIDMRHSEDPEDWKYKIQIGKDPRYS